MTSTLDPGARPVRTEATPEIDDGMRRWYASCRCCLSDAYPTVVATLDAERDAANEPHAPAGICQVVEAMQAPGASGASSEHGKEEVAAMAKILDPVCDMIVDVDQQRAKGLTSDHAGRTYAFCGPGCKRAFDKDPARFTAKVAAWEGSGPHSGSAHGGSAHDEHHGH